jgi:uncharacterized coiled-coil protein SlyX
MTQRIDNLVERLALQDHRIDRLRSLIAKHADKGFPVTTLEDTLNAVLDARDLLQERLDESLDSKGEPHEERAIAHRSGSAIT